MDGWRVAFLGCSRGLGKAVALASPQGKRLLCARSEKALIALSRAVEGEWACLDFSQPCEKWLPIIEAFEPTHIYYFAGGGPYGPYHTKKFQDHEWAFRVNFQSPARLIHWSLQRNLRQLVVVGSAVAESSGNVKAGSYAASKHALLGLCRSLWLESKDFDMRLFSPGYMDTDLLPKNASPRRVGGMLLQPEKLATLFWNWVNLSRAPRHYVVE